MTVAERTDFSELLRSLRRERDLTQREVADAINELGVACTPQAVSYWESGQRTPEDRRTAVAIDDALGARGAVLAALDYRSEAEPSLDEWMASVEERLTNITRMLDTLAQRRSKSR